MQDCVWTHARIAPNGDPDHVIEQGAIVVCAGKIAWIGNFDALPESFAELPRHDTGGKWITPSLIDCHTHLVYGGNRADEFALRLAGASYEEIARKGGG